MNKYFDLRMVYNDFKKIISKSNMDFDCLWLFVVGILLTKIAT
jgi:hypothetical protein